MELKKNKARINVCFNVKSKRTEGFRKQKWADQGGTDTGYSVH